MIEANPVPCTSPVNVIVGPPDCGVRVTVTVLTTEPEGVIDAVTDIAVPGTAAEGFAATSRIFCAFRVVGASAPYVSTSKPRTIRIQLAVAGEGVVVIKGVAGIILFNYYTLQRSY